MKKQKGITLVSLIITIVLLLIITGTTVYTSVDRFKINNLKKMYNDIELLDDKVNNYYLKYGGLPVIKDAKNNPESYTHTALDFNKDVNDNENYYIIDLSAIGDITLNYGKDGYESPNGSDDVYIINEKSHTVYYVRGIEYTDGNLYHSKKVDGDINEDTIPPTTPEIKVVEGDEIIENNYETNVTLEFVPGKDNDSGVNKTTYSINGNNEQEINLLENNQYKISEKGIYEVTLKTYDNNNNVSEATRTIYVGVEYLESTGTQYIDTELKVKEGLNTELKVRVSQKYSSDGAVFLGGQESLSSMNFFVGVGWTWGNYSFGYGNGFKKINNLNPNVNEDIIIKTTGEEIEINGVACTGSNNNNVGIFNGTEYSIYLFTRNNAGKPDGRRLSGRIYYCKLYDRNTLVRDFIPIIDENGVACLYDKVEGKFYYNQGSREFKTNLDE